ncbi:MAG: hypothetical protein HQK96_15060 [Nitrospirae bacterium]|nr:hypothetical protein [Nitrospirota bacterium]
MESCKSGNSCPVTKPNDHPITKPEMLASELLLTDLPKAEITKVTQEYEATCKDSASQETCLRSLFEIVNNDKKGLNALCLSGGGIRSASFNLGIIQGLAKSMTGTKSNPGDKSNPGLLSKFHYLSTVSGGGYIGSWLSSWIKHEQDNGAPKPLAVVEEKLRGSGEPLLNLDFNPKSPVSFLRQFSNYLTPKFGLLSADTWAIIITFVRNLILNWLVIIPFAMCTLLVPRMIRDVLYTGVNSTAFGIIAVAVYSIATVLAIVTTTIGISSSERRAVSQNNILVLLVFPLFISALLYTYIWTNWLETSSFKFYLIFFGAIAGVSAVVHILVRIYYWLQDKYNTKGQTNAPPSATQCKTICQGLRKTCLIASGVVAGFVAVAILWVVFGHFTDMPDKPWLNGPSAGAPCANTFKTDSAANHVLNDELGGILAKASDLCRIILKADKYEVSSSRTAAYVPGLYSYLFVTITPVLYLLAIMSAGLLYIGFTHTMGVADTQDVEWNSRLAAWLMIVISGWLILSAVSFFGPGIFHNAGAVAKGLIIGSGGIGAVIHRILAFNDKSKVDEAKRSTGNHMLLMALAAITIVALLILLSNLVFLFLDNGYDNIVKDINGWFGVGNSGVLDPKSPFKVEEAFAVLFVFGLIASRYADNPNKFSLHAAYRNRLVRTFLGATRLGKRHPHPFTGFDENDDIPLSSLLDKPFHVINMTLNEVNSTNLAWQQRKASSFTVTKHHSGSLSIGYRNSREYAGGIRLGTAMAISGAAASPNMGYYSSPLVSFLMAVFNVRLGYWLGNPSMEEEWKTDGPRCTIWTLIKEMFGATTCANKYIYLSDGGHFENFGLYQMVFRRCRTIIVCDASADPDYHFDDVANAVRKIRIDLGVPIEFIDKEIDDIKAKQRKGKDIKISKSHCAFATINYDAVDGASAKRGVLIYIKASLTGDEPPDVLNYAEEHEDFPHDTTANQFFTEPTFESYRKLGEHIIDCARPALEVLFM